MESSEAIRIRSSGVNLSFCPGTFKNAPRGESQRGLPRRSLWQLASRAAQFRSNSQELGRSQTCAKADGNAASASIPTKLRASRRNVRWLRRHIASRWDETGSSPRTGRTNTFCKTAAQEARGVRKAAWTESDRLKSVLPCPLLSEAPFL